ncbi:MULTISPECIES: family 1 encapsulin nanocompartment shell protein [Chitinophagaceae]
MNNLHRKLAPISEAAWAQIEQEASRTLKRYLAARRVVDVDGPKDFSLSAVGTGHIHTIDSPGDDIQASIREVNRVVELRIPFELTRQAIDDVERGSNDSDWQPLKDAARKIAFAEDRAVFEGYAAADIKGIRQGSSNTALSLPASVKNYSDMVARALNELRLAGVNGPYLLVLGADAYTAASGGSDEGYPVLHHIRELVDNEIIYAPAIQGGFVLSTRGGDFQLSIGQDISIGYLSHTDTTVKLYLQESFTFQFYTSEAVVCLNPAMK